MTYFLLVYDRRQRRLVEDVRQFSNHAEAIHARFAREANLGITRSDIEVVVLGAASEEALRNTHSRYFGSGRELSLA